MLKVIFLLIVLIAVHAYAECFKGEPREFRMYRGAVFDKPFDCKAFSKKNLLPDGIHAHNHNFYFC